MGNSNHSRRRRRLRTTDCPHAIRKKNREQPGCIAVFFSLRKSAPRQGRNHIFSLQAFIPVHHRELHSLSFHQDAVAFTANGAKVHENIIP